MTRGNRGCPATPKKYPVYYPSAWCVPSGPRQHATRRQLLRFSAKSTPDISVANIPQLKHPCPLKKPDRSALPCVWPWHLVATDTHTHTHMCAAAAGTVSVLPSFLVLQPSAKNPALSPSVQRDLQACGATNHTLRWLCRRARRRSCDHSILYSQSRDSSRRGNQRRCPTRSIRQSANQNWAPRVFIVCIKTESSHIPLLPWRRWRWVWSFRK